MSKHDPAEYRVPRNFKLLAELEEAEKGSDEKQSEDYMFVTLGLEDNDATFSNWAATIIPHQGGHIGERIYTLNIKAGPAYPDKPPDIFFKQKVVLNMVDKRGRVDFNRFYKWHRESSLMDALVKLRQAMKPASVAKACAKIPAGSEY